MIARRPPWALTVLGVAVIAIVCLPLAYLVVRVIDAGGAGLDVLERARTLELLARTIGLVAAVTMVAVAIGVPAAWLVVRTDLPRRRVWGVLLALPLVIPSYVIALALLAVGGPGGLVPGVPSLTGFPGALLGLSLATYPYVFLLCTAGLRRADPALEEAARSLGRTRTQTFRAVTLPLLRPSIGASALLVALYALSDFGVVSLVRFDALTRAIFTQYRSLFDRTPAAVLGLVLVVLTALVLVLEIRMRGRMPAPGGGSARTAERIPLGRWTAPALVFCGAVVGVAFVLPVAVLVWWLLRAEGVDAALGDLWAPAGRTLLVSALAAAVGMAAALPVAVLATRFRRRWTTVLEGAGYAANALPGVVVGLALVFFAARYVNPVYGTVSLLVLAYLVRFFAQALSGAHSALARADPRLEEAARGLGRSPLHTMRSVTLPLVAPGLLAGAALVFLSTMKELPATLMLRPIGFDTLATEVWTATGVSAYARAAPPALALCLLAAPVVYLLVVRGGRELDEIER